MVVESHWTTWSYLEDGLPFREKGSEDALMGRNTVPWVLGVVS
jgi:hypothetical protein